MNKKIQILMTAGLLGLTASCTDLDVDIDSQYTGKWRMYIMLFVVP